MNIIPVVYYPNTGILKTKILKDNKTKSGVYRWTNVISNKSYIGSSINLYLRLRTYFSTGSMNKLLLTRSSYIYRALLKYGPSNFSLEILEYCEPDKLLEREQYYIDYLKPEYNIAKIAGSPLGIKLSEETKRKISLAMKGDKNPMFGKIHTKETRSTMSSLKIGINNNMYGKTHSEKSKKLTSNTLKNRLKELLPVKITNIETSTTIGFSNYLAAGKYLGVSKTTLGKYKCKNKLLFKKYLITIIKNNKYN